MAGLFSILRAYRSYRIRRRFGLSSSVALGDVVIQGRGLTIGNDTYFNSGRIASTGEAPVRIGKWCAIGYNVTILAVTHDLNFPTGPEHLRPLKKGAVTIGDGVWVGSNAMVLPGVTIGDFAVIGANTVVRKDVPAFAVVVGNPAEVVLMKDPERCREHVTFVRQH
ncbi:MAG: acyltransferase [Flavobacteriales bacterium]|nr:acyltransferase [Flavobacteriales bacterium]